MPGLDYNEDYLQTENKIKSLETYNQVKEAEKQILSQQQSSMEMDAAQTSTPLSQIQNESKRFQRQVKTQLDRLLDLNQLLPENRVSGYTNVQTVKLVKKQFTEALTQIQSEIPQIILDEMLKQLGCSQQQTYDISVFASGIYIPVESIDLMGWLKIKPGTTIGKLFYEGKVRDIFTGFTTTTTTINSGTDGIALAASVTAPPSPEEEAFLKDESGREKLLEMASISLSNATNAYYVHSISRTKEGEINERAALLLACLRSFRVNCLVQYARFSSLPVEEIVFEETRWLSSLNITLPSERFETTRSTSSLQQRESRSPRIPASLFRVQDTPFEAPLTLEERRNDAHILSRSVTKRLALEHRDRSEFVTRRRLPRPLHLDASNESNEPLESAARALDENSSLSDVDRQYMLSIVSKALSQKKPEQFADESFLLNDDEHKAWKEPQPQWGWFDPNFAKVQDDVDDALKGRGQFSRYRGLDYQSEHIVRPEDIGERAPGGLPAGTPLETIEAAVVASADAEAAVRLAAAPKGIKIAISSPVSNKTRKPFADSVPSSRFIPIRLEVAKAAPTAAPTKKK